MSETTQLSKRAKKTKAPRTATDSQAGHPQTVEYISSPESETAGPGGAPSSTESVLLARKLQGFIDAAPEGVAVYDTAGQLVRANARYYALLARFVPNHPAATLRHWMRRSRVCDAQGRRLQEARWPHTRILQGEVIDTANAVEITLVHRSWRGGTPERQRRACARRRWTRHGRLCPSTATSPRSASWHARQADSRRCWSGSPWRARRSYRRPSTHWPSRCVSSTLTGAFCARIVQRSSYLASIRRLSPSKNVRRGSTCVTPRGSGSRQNTCQRAWCSLGRRWPDSTPRGWWRAGQMEATTGFWWVARHSATTQETSSVG